jgi:hypothetical protein
MVLHYSTWNTYQVVYEWPHAYSMQTRYVETRYSSTDYTFMHCMRHHDISTGFKSRVHCSRMGDHLLGWWMFFMLLYHLHVYNFWTSWCLWDLRFSQRCLWRVLSWDIKQCRPLKVNWHLEEHVLSMFMVACHPLSCLYLARLIHRPWRWRW